MLVYKITNRINGKVYIGQTSRTLEDRWYMHCWNTNNGVTNCAYLYGAMRKYGINNFICEPICDVPNEIADFVEMVFIAAAKSFPPELGYGYNLTAGGKDGLGTGKDNPSFGMKRSSLTCEKLRQARLNWIQTHPEGLSSESRKMIWETRVANLGMQEVHKKLVNAGKNKWSPERLSKHNVAMAAWWTPERRQAQAQKIIEITHKRAGKEA